MGKFFFPMICFEKIVKYNSEKKSDPLHFKCNFPIVSPLTNYQTKKLRIQDEF